MAQLPVKGQTVEITRNGRRSRLYLTEDAILFQGESFTYYELTGPREKITTGSTFGNVRYRLERIENVQII